MDNSQTIWITNRRELLNSYKYKDYIKKVVIDINDNKPIDINDEMFFGCENIEVLEIHNTVSLIGESAFMGCNLHTVIWEHVERIEKLAFSNNPLTNIQFNNDTYIDPHAFDDCGNAGESIVFKIKERFTNIQSFCNDSGVGYEIYEEQPRSIKKLIYEVQNFNYPAKGRKILFDISLKIYQPEVIMIIAGSGTGKSTLVKTMFGYNNSENYSYIYKDGRRKKIYLNNDESRVISSEVYFSSQKTDIMFDPKLKVKQVLEAIKNKGRKKINITKEDFREIIKRYKLEKISDSKISVLSGGETKRLSLACAAISNKSIVVLDEPDSGLDEPSAFELFIDDVRGKSVDKEGKTVIVISHHPHNYMALYKEENKRIAFEKIFTRLIVLAKGKCGGASIAFDGSPKEARVFFDLQPNDPYSRIVALVDKDVERNEEYFNRNKQRTR